MLTLFLSGVLRLPILALLRERPVNGMAHITGGGLLDNLPRVLPKETAARLHPGSWPVPPIFPLLQEIGNVSRREMYRTFNMGVGMTLVVPGETVGEIVKYLEADGERATVIGEIVPGEQTVLLA